MLLFTLIGVIMWSFGNLSAYKLQKLALVFITLCFTLVGVIIWHLWWAGASETFIWNNPTVMTLLFTHSECSFETLNAYKVPTSHTYLALAEHSLLFDFPGGPETSIWNNFRISHTMFYTRWSDHLGISTHTSSQNSHPFVSHIICRVIIWKSQSIQTLKTRTLVHNTSSIFLPRIKKSYRDFLSVDSYNYEPAKQSEVSRDGMFSFLRISAWCPPVCHYHKR